jgi:alkylhydroperoxidase family enzyme
VDINAAGGSNEGVSFEKIDALPEYQESDLFTPVEKASLELADAMSGVRAVIPDELYERLCGFYDEAEMVELAATIAMENFRSRFNRVFQLEAQGFYCPVPRA